jgi:hypothetical protein
MASSHVLTFTVGVDLPFDLPPPLWPEKGNPLGFNDIHVMLRSELFDQQNPAVSFLAHWHGLHLGAPTCRDAPARHK